jgi:hypothetical protein
MKRVLSKNTIRGGDLFVDSCVKGMSANIEAISIVDII